LLSVVRIAAGFVASTTQCTAVSSGLITTRLYIVHVLRIRVCQLVNVDKLECVTCQCPLTVKHIPIKCTNCSMVRNK